MPIQTTFTRQPSFLTGRPIHVLLSKADKLTRQEQAKTLNAVRASLSAMGPHITAQLFSSLKKSGVDTAEAVLAGWLGMEVPAKVVPPVKKSTQAVKRPLTRKGAAWGVNK